VYRTRFLYRIDMWTSDGEQVIEHLAGVEDSEFAIATYRAACKRWPGGHHPAMRYRGDRGQSTRAYSVGGRTGHERLRHFQERMPHGLFVPDGAVSDVPWPFRLGAPP